MKLSSILGLNARFQHYSFPHNSRRSKRVAASKLYTKRVLKKGNVPIPQIYAKFKSYQDVLSFDWEKLPKSFALKPSRGLGGEGIIVVKRKAKGESLVWITTNRKKISVEDLQLHAMDIIEGAYSLHNVPDAAYFEEYVGRHKAFRRLAYRGTPDIRVIVFNKVPIMAMLRLPTQESGGRANLHQGAVGVGIDIATGITTYAVCLGNPIKHKPGTTRKLHGVKIPFWDKILELAVRAQEVSGLGYLGVDIVLHPDRGPMILELNSEPGLDIQLANFAGLRRRLDKVEDLKVENIDHGVKLGIAFFASHFASRVKLKENGIKTIDVFEKIQVANRRGRKVEVQAKIDTGATRSSIDQILAQELGLLEKDNILWGRIVKSSLGRERRPVIHLSFWLKDKKIVTTASVANRKNLSKRFIIGRQDLVGFAITPKN